MINRAVLTGRLTRNVDLRYTPSGIAVGNFTLAVDRNFRNRNGQRDADFINCVIWRKSAENFANFTHKGSLVGIDGRIQTRSYDNKQGQRVYVTEVVVDNFAFLESKAQSQAQGQPNGPANRVGNYTPQSNGNQARSFNPFAKPGNGNVPRPDVNPDQKRHNQPTQVTNNAKNKTSQNQSTSSSDHGNKQLKSGQSNQSDHTKDPFANSGNKKIDISDDDLPF